MNLWEFLPGLAVGFVVTLALCSLLRRIRR